MLKPTAVFTLILLVEATAAVFAQDVKPAPKTSYLPVPVAAARQPNPVKATPESIESGKKIYSYDCASCHGVRGDGKSDVAKDLKLPDLTDPALQKERTDGAYFYILENGHGDMPKEGGRVKPEQIWDLVNYIRTLAKKADDKPAN
jgi:mono/diheme cytochrome c family protein